MERTETGTITGHVRIRSKTQGIALSLGDRITMGMCCHTVKCPRGVLTADVYCSSKRKQASSIGLQSIQMTSCIYRPVDIGHFFAVLFSSEEEARHRRGAPRQERKERVGEG